MRFWALEDFWSDELRSQYSKGLSYTAQPGSKLADLAPIWESQGKIKIDTENKIAAQAQISGVGKVT